MREDSCERRGIKTRTQINERNTTKTKEEGKIPRLNTVDSKENRGAFRPGDIKDKREY